MNVLKYIFLLLAFLAVGLGSGWLFNRVVQPSASVEVSRIVDRAKFGVPTDAVVMLSLSTCPVCKQARSWLNARGVVYRELIVDESDEAKRVADALALKVVPVFIVGDQQMAGFDGDLLAKMIESAKPR